MNYLWTVKLQEKWNFERDFNDDSIYTITATSYEKALEKATKLAMKKSFTDDETGDLCKMEAVRLIEIKRGVEIDA